MVFTEDVKNTISKTLKKLANACECDNDLV